MKRLAVSVLSLMFAFTFGIHCGLEGWITQADMIQSAPWLIMATVGLLFIVGAVS